MDNSDSIAKKGDKSLTVRGCFLFWKTNALEAFEKKEAIVPVIAGIGGAAAWIFAAYGLETLESMVPVIIGWASGCAVIWAIAYSVFWLPYKHSQERSEEHANALEVAAAKIAELEDRIRPNKFKVECGDHVPNSVTRGWPVTLSDGVNSFPSDVTFLGFTVSNPAIASIEKCRALLIKVAKGDTPIWTKQISLSFEPRSPTEREPIEEVTVENGTPRSVALCSIANDSAIMPGSLNQTSRYRGMFEGLFKEPGDYIFHVNLSGRDIPTQTERFLISWSGKSATTTIAKLGD